MKFARFFIDRPIFAIVLSVVTLLVGAVSIFQLPVSEFPDVVPPTVIVRALYPGANPKTTAETVAAPIEQEVNGVGNMLYMSSSSTADGAMTLTVTFRIGTDIDTAQVQVQNRVGQALPRLPEDVRRLGVTTRKSSPSFTMAVHLVSPDRRYDETYLRNYALLQVKDTLARIPGIGDVQLLGSGDYSMRVWLDPAKVAARGLTATDVVAAIREQNVQVAAGSLGQSPAPSGTDFQLAVSTRGRLVDEEDFGSIVVKTGAGGSKVLLRDVARLELGSSQYAVHSTLSGQPAVFMAIFQAPGSNALDVSDGVRAAMADLKQSFPQGLDYTIAYDPTQFVRTSIHEVIRTLLDALVLVVIVVIVFLQTWRASLIPFAAVPVSLVGTFAVMNAFGFSINVLSLFGMVLAIGIVVDDAIVVVENVERNIALGLSPRDATRQGMDEVTGPIIAIALVLCAVFVPIALVPGLTGQFYRQFALTIAISTVISAFNSLTLSPALAAMLLRAHGAPKDALSRLIERGLGWLFRPFNRFFAAASNSYARTVASVVRRSGIALIVYGGLIALTCVGFAKTPTGFVPTQDKQFLVAFAQLPDAASLERTSAVMHRMEELALQTPGVARTVAFSGQTINGFSSSPSAGVMFVILKPFEERTTRELTSDALAATLNQKFATIEEASAAALPAPAIAGLGNAGGFKLYLEDRGNVGLEPLHDSTQRFLGAAQKKPALTQLFSGFEINVPQLFADVDRTKAMTQRVLLPNVFETMQANLGSLYVNDFNRFGRTFQVNVQAEPRARVTPADVLRLETRNADGAMVPLGSFVRVNETSGPDRITRYNGYQAAEINGGVAPGFSSGDAIKAINEVARAQLPAGIKFEWTELMFQQISAGNATLLVFPLCVLLVFLVLAAQYESWTLPLIIILIVPTCLLAAVTGVWLDHGDNNIFTQIGLFVLIALACKNAILIVEFAKEKQDAGLSPREAVLEACRLRMRPILMTSIAFIMGVWPLVRAAGAGSEVRHALGVAVFAGMIGVTIFGLLLTPVFYVVLQRRARLTSPSALGPALPAHE